MVTTLARMLSSCGVSFVACVLNSPRFLKDSSKFVPRDTFYYKRYFVKRHPSKLNFLSCNVEQVLNSQFPNFNCHSSLPRLSHLVLHLLLLYPPVRCKVVTILDGVVTVDQNLAHGVDFVFVPSRSGEVFSPLLAPPLFTSDEHPHPLSCDSPPTRSHIGHPLWLFVSHNSDIQRPLDTSNRITVQSIATVFFGSPLRHN